jgi:hypothetical protein
MTDEQLIPPRVGDSVPVAIIRDASLFYMIADNAIIGELAFPNAKVLEVSYLATQSVFEAQEMVIVSTSDDGQSAQAQPSKVVGGGQQFHKATVRMVPAVALEMAVAVFKHSLTSGIVAKDDLRTLLDPVLAD